jgi:phage N-6-adenine-methyltransferase
MSATSDCYRTPFELWSPLDDEFDFDCDVAANAENAIAADWYGPGSEHIDALVVPWTGWNACWMNPPYSETGKWVRKAADEAQNGATVVGLIPFMPSEGWWQHVERSVEVRRIPHRIKFLNPDGTQAGTARFASAVVVWRPQPGISGYAPPRYVTWSWRAFEPKEVGHEPVHAHR